MSYFPESDCSDCSDSEDIGSGDDSDISSESDSGSDSELSSDEEPVPEKSSKKKSNKNNGVNKNLKKVQKEKVKKEKVQAQKSKSSSTKGGRKGLGCVPVKKEAPTSMTIIKNNPSFKNKLSVIYKKLRNYKTISRQDFFVKIGPKITDIVGRKHTDAGQQYAWLALMRARRVSK